MAHVLQTITELDEDATIVSVGGIKACDLISRKALLDGLLSVERGEQLLPFVGSFYEDEMGTNHRILQGEGGEQGDPLMPLLFSLGQHRALTAIQDLLMEGERLFAFLDDIYVICNLRGSRTCPEAVVWRGDQSLETKVQGFKDLGAPIGHPDFVAEFLAKKSREHEVLFDRIPAMEDLQSAWLVLLFCAAPRANFWLRMVRPEMVAQLAESHDANTWGCLARLIGAEPSAHSQVTASLQFSQGGLGLTSAARGCWAGHWASWTDCLAMINKPHPEVGSS